MAAAPIILGAVGGGALGYTAATALTMGVAATAATTAAGAVVGAAIGASLMSGPSPQAMETSTVTDDDITVDTVETDDTEVNTTSDTGGSDTTINDVTAVQDDVFDQADTTVQGDTSVGQAETEAMDFYEKGRKSTILTSAQGIADTATGLLSETGSSILRPRRGLGGGLIA